eukprot:TRINITY_DN8195_c0_g2_i3.p1 TRINITY_DN8195_c0_g2~~TRINITY_DN8195_c0_g2_i3.p1  ORF type:complete len:470 (+),score=72.40 TRINITY_DN8195_c0_g2_i3:76-1410(+)
MALCVLSIAKQVSAQQAGTVKSENPPAIPLQHCTKGQAEQAALVLDANWRWVHNVGGYQNCFTNGEWNQAFCPDPETCRKNCALEGIDAKGYSETYGVQGLPEGVELKYVSPSGNVGSRLYVTDRADAYKTFKLLNREFTLDVDVSKLACGMNGAVYFVEMDPLGGKGKNHNAAGAKYGTGYCDAQCALEKFENSEERGICCAELDIWEANRHASAYTVHPCSTEGPSRCEGIDCGFGEGNRWSGLCDKDGCDMNPFRMLNKSFYGPGAEYVVDTTRPMTVVTQFLTHDGSDEGTLSEIRRIYLQAGKVIAHANSNVDGVEGNSITDEFCNAGKAAFGDFDHHQAKGGLRNMGEAMKRGMVLTLSLWDDGATQMRWLDSTFPPDAPAEQLGVLRGPCDPMVGTTDHLRQHNPDAWVRYTNLKYGEIGTTYAAGGRRLESRTLVV